MALTTSQARLFGLDLSAVWEELKRPWRDTERWALMRWLTPELPVRLRQADGGDSLWRGDRLVRRGPGIAASAARFSAVELPEDMVLRRNLALPAALTAPDIAAAVELELRSVSPFPADDVAWGYGVRRAAPQRQQVEAVLASRRQITAQLDAQEPLPEVWALSSAGQPIVVRGFGEDRRARHGARWRRIGLALLASASVLLAAIAVTPTAQLRIRALEAVEAYDAVQTRTTKLTQEREALVQASDRLKTLAELLGNQARPVQVLDQLTRMLPDDTYLQGLKIEGRKIAITGYTTDTASLMQQLGNQPGVHDVRAPAPATRPPGATRELFQIEFGLDPERALAAAPAASAASAAAPATGASAAGAASTPVVSAPGPSASRPAP